METYKKIKKCVPYSIFTEHVWPSGIEITCWLVKYAHSKQTLYRKKLA